MSANTRKLMLAETRRPGQPGFTITPAMREKAAGPADMFSRGTAGNVLNTNTLRKSPQNGKRLRRHEGPKIETGGTRPSARITTWPSVTPGSGGCLTPRRTS